MPRRFSTRSWVLLLAAFLMTARNIPAHAQTIQSNQPASDEAARPSLVKPFVDTLGDFRHLPRRNNLDWLAVGLSAALVAHPADARLARTGSEPPNHSFRAGAVIGGTPFELGAAFATYAIARATNSPRGMNLGGDLIRAQLLSQLMTVGVKQGVRRARPEGSGFSFPSGHSAISFASATVLEQHFGWKAGVPAYAVASYVAASRVQMRRHYLSDVATGAILGILAGRTVTVGHGYRFMVAPLATTNGAGASLTWVGK
jgi:membrane-associated phospholipid phosphatase